MALSSLPFEYASLSMTAKNFSTPVESPLTASYNVDQYCGPIRSRARGGLVLFLSLNMSMMPPEYIIDEGSHSIGNVIQRVIPSFHHGYTFIIDFYKLIKKLKLYKVADMPSVRSP